eukprot:TRINITY_DN38475_c0_g1_i2.p1 TRINITY_DN38475_c0_g1~~TRINITY_DN38475_c0_g1_i2.p1  ORF type:complete len:447 (+),score=99.58 TRINITY_DN38475_c0_g1_i2:133-1341(+)
MDGTIFAFGGSDEESVGSALIQKFNWHSKQWVGTGHMMTPRNFPAVTQVPASMFEKVKIASKEDLKNTVGAEWVNLRNIAEEDKRKVLLESLKLFAPPGSLKQLRNIFVPEEKETPSVRNKDLKILGSLHLLCRVKTLTNFPGHEIILPGELDVLTDDCKVTLDGKAYNIKSYSPFRFHELLIPGSDVLIWVKLTQNILPKGLVNGGTKKGQTVYICQSHETQTIGHAYMEEGNIICAVHEEGKEKVIGVPNFSLLSVEGEYVEKEIEYGEHPNEHVHGLEEMNVDSMVEEWEKEEKQERIRFIEWDYETKAFPIPEGWEVIQVDSDNFEKYLEKLPSPKIIPKTLSETTLNFEHFTFWYGDGMDYLMAYQNMAGDIVDEYMYDAIETGTGKFIRKNVKKRD